MKRLLLGAIAALGLATGCVVEPPRLPHIRRYRGHHHEYYDDDCGYYRGPSGPSATFSVGVGVGVGVPVYYGHERYGYDRYDDCRHHRGCGHGY